MFISLHDHVRTLVSKLCSKINEEVLKRRSIYMWCFEARINFDGEEKPSVLLKVEWKPSNKNNNGKEIKRDFGVWKKNEGQKKKRRDWKLWESNYEKCGEWINYKMKGLFLEEIC